MRVLVTGASPGIGGTTCRLLAERAREKGEKIRIAACEVRETDSLHALREELTGMGAEVIVPTGDLADPATPGKLVEEALSAFGGLDAVVSNAGYTGPAPLMELTLESWDRMFAVNVRATLLLAQAAYEALRESRGSLVAVASMSGMFPHEGMGAYSASKAALIMLIRQLGQEWAKHGVRANAVSPGMVQSPLTAAVYADPELSRTRNGMVPMGRVAQPEDIGRGILMLLSPDAGYVTGQNLLVDGGFSESILATIPGRPKSQVDNA